MSSPNKIGPDWFYRFDFWRLLDANVQMDRQTSKVYCGPEYQECVRCLGEDGFGPVARWTI